MVGLSYGVTREEAEWADGIFERYPDRNGILLTHDYLAPSTQPDGRNAQLRRARRLAAVQHGRAGQPERVPRARRARARRGHEREAARSGEIGDGVVELLADYQFYTVSAGQLGLTEIGGYEPDRPAAVRRVASSACCSSTSTAASMIVDTYSPLLDEFGATEYDTGTGTTAPRTTWCCRSTSTSRHDVVQHRLAGAVRARPAVIGETTVASGEVASVEWTGLEAGTHVRLGRHGPLRRRRRVDVRARRSSPRRMPRAARSWDRALPALPVLRAGCRSPSDGHVISAAAAVAVSGPWRPSSARAPRRLLPAVAMAAVPAAAHDADDLAYAHGHAAGGADDAVELDLEYDLLMKSAWLRRGVRGDRATTSSSASSRRTPTRSTAYVTDRFVVAAERRACARRRSRAADSPTSAPGRPYVRCLRSSATAAAANAASTRSPARCSPTRGSFVHSTETIVLDLDEEEGSAVLLDRRTRRHDRRAPRCRRFGEFFVLGAEHLLFGLDHVLFLLALLIGARRLRDVVLAATSFTVAHSVTFLLAAMGVVSAARGDRRAGHRAVDRASAALAAAVGACSRREPRRPVDVAADVAAAVVFAFGLVHGLGFAGALGIDEPWSWALLWSLLAFNVGIEAVQLGSSRWCSRCSCCCDAPRRRIRRRAWPECWSAWSASSGSPSGSSPPSEAARDAGGHARAVTRRAVTRRASWPPPRPAGARRHRHGCGASRARRRSSRPSRPRPR